MTRLSNTCQFGEISEDAGVVSHRCVSDAPDNVRLIRTLGHGRAATAELVEASWDDGRSQCFVEKVFAPGLLTRCIYRLAFAAPFAYQSNQHAILACFYRRRVVSRMLEASATCDERESSVDVALPAYVRYDRNRDAYVLAASFVEGRGPIPTCANSNLVAAENEMAGLVAEMRRVERQLIDFGLVGSGWQVSPGAMVSTANLLLSEHPGLRVVHSDGPEADSPRSLRHTIIDLESGIPAILVWRYLWQSWRRGAVFPFDDLDSRKLRASCAELCDRLVLRGERDLAAELSADVEALVAVDEQWKAGEIAPTRRPWTWLSAQRRAHYRRTCIDRWQQQRVVDPENASGLETSFWFFALMWMLGLCPPSVLGRWLQSCLANQSHQERVRRFATESRVRSAFWTKYRRRQVKALCEQQRCSRRTRPTSSLGFIGHRLLRYSTTAGVHRYLVDPSRRARRNCQIRALLFRGSYQIAVGRKAFRATTRRWQSRKWLTEEEAKSLHSQFSGPQLAVYSRGLGMHLAIKFLYPLITPLKVGGIAMALTGGSVWFAVLPIMILPAARTLVTLFSLLANRSHDVPHRHALCVGAIPVVGSAAFIVQMWTANPAVSRFLLRDFASRFARKIPIYGGPDSRTEHAVLAIGERLLRLVAQFHPTSNEVSASMAMKNDSDDVQTSLVKEQSRWMRWPYQKVIRDSLLVTGVGCGGLWATNYLLSDSLPEQWLTGENGALESAQLMVLICTAIAGCLALLRVKSSSWQSIAVALVCVAVAGAAREVPSAVSQASLSDGAHQTADSVGFAISATWKHGVIAVAVCIWLSRVAYAWLKFPEDRKLWFSPTFVWPAIPFAACFVLAELFERSKWVTAEETVEVFGYTMMMTVAIWMIRNADTLQNWLSEEAVCEALSPVVPTLRETECLDEGMKRAA
ncbi:hypothetical protein [Rhodopirellula europaea]|uniref:hypothetical protein n=1 Tax=Rhodopirellula europaea TaxID=1263866 RepID=UPI000348890F|nr:hypothetical protein [Rhodopirellula europaea]